MTATAESETHEMPQGLMPKVLAPLLLAIPLAAILDATHASKHLV